MDAIHTETTRQAGHTYRIAIYPDENAPNPLDDWCEMGTILSLNRRHHNFDPGGIKTAIEGNGDAVPLAYYEHGLCRWSVAGELPAECRCPFDSVPFAGVWVPDTATLASAARYGGRTRHHFMRKRARQACDTYTRWYNGEIYGYRVERIDVCPASGGTSPEDLDSCWGFFDLGDCLAEARAAVAARAGQAVACGVVTSPVRRT